MDPADIEAAQREEDLAEAQAKENAARLLEPEGVQNFSSFSRHAQLLAFDSIWAMQLRGLWPCFKITKARVLS